ncbi:glycoside hydrolase family 5 protein [Hydnum rufescens UP504]|uniref:Glycoside hydrolase family 5 protein n=1 Tax=Hydnum rufescens UP504 TaxID=1448309 RepID=A0A9P6AKR9_9AGAM|nr:glycoside hydrolase family 5 protein [Hydnum rufescens UP504]
MKPVALSYLPLLFLASAHADLRFPYGSQPVRGVNLGGWLVLEPWITPSLFDSTGNPKIVDEWTFGELQDQHVAARVLHHHWSTFYTEDDFIAIAKAGLNHVRIPIGYWALDTSGGEPYISGQYPYLQDAVTWAGNHRLKVLIDIHGVPGSQNGFDNSGHRGPANWANDPNNIARTKAVITTLTQEFSKSQYSNSVTAISLINEPAPFKSQNILQAARQLYLDSYSLVRKPYSDNRVGDLVMVISDAFQALELLEWLYDRSVPVHGHAEVAKSYNEHISTMCQVGRDIQNNAASNIGTLVGEWSTASTDCAKYLNGYNVGSRYDKSFNGGKPDGSCGPKTGSTSGFSPEYKTFMRQYYEAQVASWEQGLGWIYWAWKNEDADDWSYKAGLDGGWIPYDPTSGSMAMFAASECIVYLCSSG